MGLRSKGFYATIWEVKKGAGNYMEVRLSTSRRDPKDDKKFITDFSGYTRFVGNQASDLAKNLRERDRIFVDEFEVTNSYNKEKNQTYTNITVFHAVMASEVSRGGAQQRPAPAPDHQDGFMNVPDGVEEEGLPFD